MIQCDDFDPHPVVYRTFMAGLSIVTPPLNAFAIYCITRKSTKQMGFYKWWLLMYQLSSCVFDFVFTILIVPVVFFPIPMGYADSLLARLISLNGHVALILFISCIPLLTVTCLYLFIYRCYVLLPHYHILKMNRRGIIVTSTTLLLIYCIPTASGLVVILPDQAEARGWMLKEYSCARLVINAPRLQIYTPTSIRPLVLVATSLGILATIVIIFALYLSFNSIRNSPQLSQRTRLMQRRYIFYLCVQVSIPLTTLLVPIMTLMYLFGIAASLDQANGNLALCCMGLHGFTSPLSLLLCNDNYRNFIFRRLKLRCLRKKQKAHPSVTIEPITRSFFERIRSTVN